MTAGLPTAFAAAAFTLSVIVLLVAAWNYLIAPFIASARELAEYQSYMVSASLRVANVTVNTTEATMLVVVENNGGVPVAFDNGTFVVVVYTSSGRTVVDYVWPGRGLEILDCRTLVEVRSVEAYPGQEVCLLVHLSSSPDSGSSFRLTLVNRLGVKASYVGEA